MFTKVAQVAECRTRHTSSYIVEGATTTAAVTHCVCVCTLKREPRRSKAREPFLDTKSKIRLLSLSLHSLRICPLLFFFFFIRTILGRISTERKREKKKHIQLSESELSPHRRSQEILSSLVARTPAMLINERRIWLGIPHTQKSCCVRIFQIEKWKCVGNKITKKKEKNFFFLSLVRRRRSSRRKLNCNAKWKSPGLLVDEAFLFLAMLRLAGH